MRVFLGWLLLAALGWAGLPAWAAPVQVRLEVPFAPRPVRVDGRQVLVYELHLTQMSKHPDSLERLEVLDPQGKVLSSLQGQELTAATLSYATPSLGPGQTCVVLLWIPVQQVPQHLSHRLSLASGSLVCEEPVPVLTDSPTVLGPPVHGGTWFCDGGPGNGSYHRRTLVTLGGRSRIAQRYAIDWEMRSQGCNYRGPVDQNSSYLCYGQEVLAVADAQVVGRHDGVRENVPGALPGSLPLEDVGGNSLALDLGGGRFALYAHMQPGSLRVSVGERVRQGQVLGLIGNSGNSSEPHLHMHVADRPSFLASEGLPYAFDHYQVVTPGGLEEHQNDLPGLDRLVDFGP